MQSLRVGSTGHLGRYALQVEIRAFGTDVSKVSHGNGAKFRGAICSLKGPMMLGESASGRKQVWPGRRVDLVLSETERWYVVRSLPRQETRAETQLLVQGFRPFLPRVEKTVRHARQMRTVKVPVFATYMFIVLDLQKDRWRSVNGTFGVASLIMAKDSPAPVPLGIVEQLLDCTDEIGLTRFDRNLREGQSIRVTSGPFAHIVGRLERLDANGRVRALLDIMGGKVNVLLNSSAVETA